MTIDTASKISIIFLFCSLPLAGFFGLITGRITSRIFAYSREAMGFTILSGLVSLTIAICTLINLLTMPVAYEDISVKAILALTLRAYLWIMVGTLAVPTIITAHFFTSRAVRATIKLVENIF